MYHTPVKVVHYDADSLEPQDGDQVEITIQRIGQDPETLIATYLGVTQLASYTTPYFKFLTAEQGVRLICTNDVREFHFHISQPQPPAQQLPLDPEPPF